MSKTERKKIFGAALDIGTTDIKGLLIDVISGKELARARLPNEQIAFGQDVITRLHFASKRGGLKELNTRVIRAINKLLRHLAGESGVGVGDIKKIVAVGNSAMYHLVLMIRPDTLAKAPYLSAEKKLQERDANEMGICAGKDSTFKFLPNISGFVGSDILASILVTEMHRKKYYSLIMDIGTNGEIAVGSKEKIFVTSCASGPAFEARHISCGMPAREGAIIGAKAAKRGFSLRTVGNILPKGISGSGLIDIVSILLDKGVVDRRGRMRCGEFTIYRRADKKIYLTQKDIRQLQLAKAALSAGIEILKKRAGIDIKEIERFYITGSFGIGINRKNAKNIGLIPKEILLNKVSFLKDGALSGAREVLLKASWEAEIDDILAKCEHVELHRDREFEEVFARAMSF